MSETKDHVHDVDTRNTDVTHAAGLAVSQESDIVDGSQRPSKGHFEQIYLTPSRTRSRSPDTLSLVSADDFSEFRLGRTTSRDETVAFTGSDDDSEQSRVRRLVISCRKSWIRNKGLAFVLISQVFATLMGVTTRLLENGSDTERGLDPFQILFARMSITFACAMAYMWYTKVEHYPLGAPGVRLLLVFRGVGGFFGVFGLYWSLQYLSLADATVISFLGPPLACYMCSKILKQPFTRAEQIAVFVSLIGIVLIARPTSLFPSNEDSKAKGKSASKQPPTNDRLFIRDDASDVTPEKRLAAIGMALVGVLGAAVAYTTIRWIGKRAHPLISVNYFASWCTLVSAVVLAFVPSVPFILPHTLRQWVLLFFIGISGFVMQFLMTAGLSYEKSSRANNMVYTQMIFALAADATIFGELPSLLSLAGSSLILGSAVVVAVQKDKGQAQTTVQQDEQQEQRDINRGANDIEQGRGSRDDSRPPSYTSRSEEART